jgi:hypothetical protein
MYNLELFDDFELDGIDTSDYPDFCDVFICSASYNGLEANDDQLEWINDNCGEFIYNLALNQLF